MLIWLAYFLLPTDAGGIVHGLPLGPIDAVALLALAWLWAAGRRLPGAWIVGILLVLTFITGRAIPGEGGLRARYFANAAAAGSHERSTEFPAEAFTRIDRRLDFAPEGPEFPLPFVNDNSRFNFYKVGEPQRRLLEFAVRWSGLWWVDEERVRLYLDAPQASAQLFVDGAEVISLTPDSGSPIVREMTLARGWHRLDVGYSSPYAGPRRFSAGIIAGDTRQPFTAQTVVTQQIRDWQMTSSGWLSRFKLAADVALLATLAWMLVTAVVKLAATFRRGAELPARVRQAMLLFAAVAAAEAVVFAWPWSTHNMVLLGGDDTMTYEGYARDILFNGILMNGGRPAGQGEPFYYQAFYPYFLAATHYLFGEGMFGTVLVQRLLAAFCMWTLVRIAIALHGERAWIVALPIASAFIAWKFWPIAAQPLNESLYVPLLAATARSLIEMTRHGQPWRGFRSGVLSGLTTITRSTALLAWFVVWPVCWMAMQGSALRRRVLIVMIATFFAIFSLVTIRNWIVAGVFAPTSTELGITLLGGNEIPPGVTINTAPRAALYQRFRISDPTAMVVEYALTAPGLFITNLGRKALFALGYYEPYAPGWGLSPVYVAVWMSAVAGVFLLWRTRPGVEVWIPALIALTQFVAVVIVYPKGERLILPIHVLLLPYSIVAASRAAQAVTARGGVSPPTRASA